MTGNKRKMWLMMLCIIMVASLFAACSKDDKKDGGSKQSSQPEATIDSKPIATGETSAESYFPLKQMTEIKALMPDFGRTRDKRTDKELEKMTNIKFNWELTPSSKDLAERINLLMASGGNLPDIMVMKKAEFNKYQDSGKFIDFSQYLDKMPNLKAYIEKYPDIVNFVKTPEGKINAINNFTKGGNLPVGYIYREDIYKANNIPIPTTFDEMYQGLKKLKEIYPDKYPLSPISWHMPSYMYLAYHTSDTVYFDTDSLTYKYGPATSNFMDSLNFIRKLYSEKLLDPEFPVTDEDSSYQKMITSKGLMTIHYLGEMEQMNEKGKKVDPNLNLVAALPPVTDTGLQARVQVTMPSSNSWFTVISKDSKYVDELVHFLDFQFSDQVTDLVNWGFEGETFIKKNGVNTLTPDVKTVSNPNGTINLSDLGVDSRTGFWPIMDYDAVYASNFSETTIQSLQSYTDNAEKIGSFIGPNINLPSAMEADRGRIMESVDTRVREFAMNYITGKIDENKLKQELSDIESKGDYKPFLDYYNAEFNKIKAGFVLNTKVK